MRKISDSTVRRLSVYLRFLEQAKAPTLSSGELARLGGTTSAQVRKDLSFFGSFGKRGLGYAVPELTRRIRDILGLERGYRVVLVGAGRMGGALVQYHGFRQRGFHITAIYDQDARKIDRKSTRLNSSHLVISYAVFCLKKKKKNSIYSRELSPIALTQRRVSL